MRSLGNAKVRKCKSYRMSAERSVSPLELEIGSYSTRYKQMLTHGTLLMAQQDFAADAKANTIHMEAITSPGWICESSAAGSGGDELANTGGQHT